MKNYSTSLGRSASTPRLSLVWRWLLVVFLALPTRPLLAQNTGVIRGVVADSASGQPLPGVGIRLLGQPGGTATDALGYFRFSSLPAGTYTVQAAALGYGARPRVVLLSAGETRALTLALPTAALSLREVTVSQPRDITQSVASIARLDQVLRPVNSAQDLLRLVPGLFIAQHAGGGKAEQIFLRGFDCDHGTDFAVSIDGLPVNMVSHAHGQGYADFHFVIPETVDQLRVYKGPYTARFGDFATAGAGEFTTKTSLEHSQVKVELGQFDTRRALVMLDLLGHNGRHLLSKRPESAYVAAEYSFTNSYFDQKQHFKRFNGLAKYTGQLSERTSLTLLGSRFASRWDASGQIPERGVREGLISRYGSVDPTEGGRTGRTNASAVLTTGLAHDAVLRQQLYYSKYDFNLYSNFTFYLQDPVNGDEIHQADARHLLGYSATYDRALPLGSRSLQSTLGVGTRNDFATLGLFHTVRRDSLLGTITSGRLYERNINAYLDETLALTDRLTLNAAARLDVFTFDFRGQLYDTTAQRLAPLRGRVTKALVSPKLNVSYQLTPAVQLFARSGFGFHSNDARGVIRGAATDRVLPRALGYEAGTTFKSGPSLVVNAALWSLHLQDELVYIGDAGEVENTGPTQRYGVDMSVRYQVSPTLFADVDLNYNHGRQTEAPAGANYIPLAPTVTSTGGLTLKRPGGFGASLRYRAIDDRPANDDGSITAQGYFLLDAAVSYTRARFQLGATAENLLNTEWNQAQFATETRLRNESAPVDELHFTPGTPFFLKLNASVFF